MSNFQPDYTNIVDAANNIKPKRIPIYEHHIHDSIISSVMNHKLYDIEKYSDNDLNEYFKFYISFYTKMGYDTVSFERILSGIMPGNGALYDNKDGCIKNYDDYKKYPWDDLMEIYFNKNDRYFQALARSIPTGMKAIGGVGNGVFECVQDITGYINLCYIKSDDPDLYKALFKKMGKVLLEIWTEFLNRYSDIYCVVRIGDDLGFKTNTLLPPKDIIENIIPLYKAIIDLAHKHQKPFLLHSCGKIFSVMNELIKAGIDAKHSNEDEIAPMDIWYKKYGSKIGNFGGIDSGVLCKMNKEEIRSYVKNIYSQAIHYNGVALGSGNSIPDYVPVENYLYMIEVLNELRN